MVTYSWKSKGPLSTFDVNVNPLNDIHQNEFAILHDLGQLGYQLLKQTGEIIPTGVNFISRKGIVELKNGDKFLGSYHISKGEYNPPEIASPQVQEVVSRILKARNQIVGLKELNVNFEQGIRRMVLKPQITLIQKDE